MTRLIPLQGVTNFRDFGDYSAAGRRLRRGKLYRSAHHAHATDSDLEAIDGLGIGVVVDLRRAEERARDPSRRGPAFKARVIENDLTESVIEPWISFLSSETVNAETMHGYMCRYYTLAPFEGRYVDLFTRYFEALASEDGPILIHCAAGKDRTGMLAALTHTLTGVHEDDVRDDYLLTNTAVDLDARLPTIMANISAATGRPPPPEDAVRTTMSVKPEYLNAALDAMRNAHGSIEGYMENVLGVTAGARAQIEARLLA